MRRFEHGTPRLDNHGDNALLHHAGRYVTASTVKKDSSKSSQDLCSVQICQTSQLSKHCCFDQESINERKPCNSPLNLSKKEL